MAHSCTLVRSGLWEVWSGESCGKQLDGVEGVGQFSHPKAFHNRNVLGACILKLSAGNLAPSESSGSSNLWQMAPLTSGLLSLLVLQRQPLQSSTSPLPPRGLHIPQTGCGSGRISSLHPSASPTVERGLVILMQAVYYLLKVTILWFHDRSLRTIPILVFYDFVTKS